MARTKCRYDVASGGANFHHELELIPLRTLFLFVSVLCCTLFSFIQGEMLCHLSGGEGKSGEGREGGKKKKRFHLSEMQVGVAQYMYSMMLASLTAES